MLQQRPYFLLSRPLTYFGTFEQMERKSEEDFFEQESVEIWEFMRGAHEEKRTEEKIGLFIHWFDN